MADKSETPVLKRMTASRAHAAILSEMSIAKSLRHAFAKAGDEVLSVAISVQNVTDEVILPEALNDRLPDPALLIRLDGDDGALGLAVLCPQFIGAVIEARTIGAVLTSAAPDRRPTPTDAALTAAFIDPALARFAVLSAQCRKPPPVAGYTCGAAFADLRAVQLKLADAEHFCLRFSVDFGGGNKIGTVSFVFPVEQTQGSTTGTGTQGWHASLEKAVLSTTALLEAQLCRLSLPLDEVSKFAPGDLVSLSGATVNGVSLMGATGSRIINARLGRSGPDRAVRLSMATEQATALNAPAFDVPAGAAAVAPVQMGADTNLVGAAPRDMATKATPGETSAGIPEAEADRVVELEASAMEPAVTG